MLLVYLKSTKEITTTHSEMSVHSRIELELILEMLAFKMEGKTRVPGKNLSEQSREPRTNLAHIWCLVQEWNTGHIAPHHVHGLVRHIVYNVPGSA